MKPGPIWYFVAVLIFLAGDVGAWYMFTVRLASVGDGVERFIVPGTVELTLNQPGTWTIYHEPSSAIDGKLYVSQNINGLRIGVVSVANGAPVKISPPFGGETYSMNGSDGVAVLAFDVASPGRYRLTAAYEGDKAEPKAVLTVANGLLHRMFSAIAGGISLGLGGFAIALAIIITTAVKRGKAVHPPAGVT
jgi:hypothetical protein